MLPTQLFIQLLSQTELNVHFRQVDVRNLQVLNYQSNKFRYCTFYQSIKYTGKNVRTQSTPSGFFGVSIDYPPLLDYPFAGSLLPFRILLTCCMMFVVIIGHLETFLIWVRLCMFYTQICFSTFQHVSCPSL